MNSCWSEGALRAYLDRELPPADMKAVAAHLGDCSTCDALCAELAGRAARVFELLETLAPAAPVAAPVVRPRVSSPWLWTGAAVALAAGLAIASLVIPKREQPRPQPVANVEAPVETPVAAQPPQPAEVAAVREARPVPVRVMPRRRVAPKDMDYFVALDDQPIESGVIMRMAIQPGNAQADIVFDPAGRARAIRLVSNK